MHLISENFFAMRAVDQRRWEYQALKDSMQHLKLIKPIIVRKRGDRYEIIDGLHRFACAKDLGWTEINCDIQERDDDESIIMQIIANAVDVPTKPCEYALQIRRILSRNPSMTLRMLAGTVYKTPEWVQEQLGLLRLSDKIQSFVNAGAIKLQNAYVLSRLPHSWHDTYAEHAMVLTHEEFKALVLPAFKNFTEGLLAGRVAEEKPFEPTPALRSIKSCREGIDNDEIAGRMIVVSECDSLVSAFKAGVKWVMRLDPDSVAQQQAAAIARKLDVDRDAARRKRERMERGKRRQMKESDTTDFPFPFARGNEDE